MLRDGSRSLPPRTAEIEGPLRSTRLEATAYGPLVVTVFAGRGGSAARPSGHPADGAERDRHGLAGGGRAARRTTGRES